MPQPLVLYSYRYSVYCWIVLLTLAEKQLSFAVCELNPFYKDQNQARFERSPFGMVPVLTHCDFTLYESAAICRYIDLSFQTLPWCRKSLWQLPRWGMRLALSTAMVTSL